MSNKFRRLCKDKYAAFKKSRHLIEQDDLIFVARYFRYIQINRSRDT